MHFPTNAIPSIIFFSVMLSLTAVLRYPLQFMMVIVIVVIGLFQVSGCLLMYYSLLGTW